MSNGYVPYLLLTAKEVYKGNNPGQKVTPPGFLRMLLENSKPNVVSSGVDDGSGHIKEVRVKYRPRVRSGATVAVDDCSIQARPAYSEATVGTTLFRKYSYFLDDDTIAKYSADASRQVQTVQGLPVLTGQITPFMQEQWDLLMEAANAVMGDINKDLLTKQASNFGKNQTTGLTTAKTINFPLDATNNDLTAGMSGLLADARANEIDLSKCAFVGSGLLDNYILQQAAKTAAQNGLNTAAQITPNFYQDFYAVSQWGANQFGIFEKDAVQLIDVNRYVGFKAGMKPGGSWFGNIPLPVMDSQGNMIMMRFDIQMRYIDCPESVAIGDEYVSNVGRGWQIIVSKSFDLFNQPNDMYTSSDRLTGVNGTLRYTATNS